MEKGCFLNRKHEPDEPRHQRCVENCSFCTVQKATRALHRFFLIRKEKMQRYKHPTGCICVVLECHNSAGLDCPMPATPNLDRLVALGACGRVLAQQRATSTATSADTASACNTEFEMQLLQLLTLQPFVGKMPHDTRSSESKVCMYVSGARLRGS